MPSSEVPTGNSGVEEDGEDRVELPPGRYYEWRRFCLGTASSRVVPSNLGSVSVARVTDLAGWFFSISQLNPHP